MANSVKPMEYYIFCCKRFLIQFNLHQELRADLKKKDSKTHFPCGESFLRNTTKKIGTALKCCLGN